MMNKFNLIELIYWINKRVCRVEYEQFYCLSPMQSFWRKSTTLVAWNSSIVKQVLLNEFNDKRKISHESLIQAKFELRETPSSCQCYFPPRFPVARIEKSIEERITNAVQVKRVAQYDRFFVKAGHHQHHPSHHVRRHVNEREPDQHKERELEAPPLCHMHLTAASVHMIN